MPRLPQGINKRKDGLLEKRFTIDGKRYSIYAHTVKELQEKELTKRQEIKEHGDRKNSAVTLDEYFKEWLEQKPRSAKPSTIQRYSLDYRNHICDILGKRKVVDIERREILNMTKKIQNETSIYMENYCLVLISAILRGLKTDHFSIHALRDTFATQFIEGGGNPQTLKTILGHSTLAMTMDLYAHVLPNTKAEETIRIIQNGNRYKVLVKDKR